MDEIQRLPSAASIKQQLQTIPDELLQIYDQIFATMERSLSPLQLRLAQQTYLWIDMSDFVQLGGLALTVKFWTLYFKSKILERKCLILSL
jgi:hypothetical protein